MPAATRQAATPVNARGQRTFQLFSQSDTLVTSAGSCTPAACRDDAGVCRALVMRW